MKLKGLWDALRVWNKEVFGNIERRKKLYLEDISRWDKNEEDQGLDLGELAAQKEAQRELERVFEMEEVMWC